MHWIGAQFGICMFLHSTDKSGFQNVSGFHLQSFRLRTKKCNVNFVDTLLLFRRAKIGSCSGKRKCKWNLQNYADNAYILLI